MKKPVSVTLTTAKNGDFLNLQAIVAYDDGSRSVLPLSVTWGNTIDRKKSYFLCKAVNEITCWDEVQSDDDLPF